MSNVESLTVEIGDDMDMTESENKFLNAIAIINKRLSHFLNTKEVKPPMCIVTSKLKFPDIKIPIFDGTLVRLLKCLKQ